MSKMATVAALILLAACAAHNDPLRVDDASTGQSVDHFSYRGQWEHTRDRNDGRYKGTSSRSRHSGDSVVLPFDGSVVRIYGIRGANGGNAAIGIDGQYYGMADFFSPRKQVHALVFESPPLRDGTHALGLVVRGDVRTSHHAYVNIDEVQVLHGP